MGWEALLAAVVLAAVRDAMAARPTIALEARLFLGSPRCDDILDSLGFPSGAILLQQIDHIDDSLKSELRTMLGTGPNDDVRQRYRLRQKQQSVVAMTLPLLVW